MFLFICAIFLNICQYFNLKRICLIFTLSSDSQLKEYSQRFGWTEQADGTLFIQNHEATIKSRNIEEKLEFAGNKFV